MAARVFLRAVKRLGLKPNTPVAVAVSGGSDSVALALLARQVFERVVTVTVDHRLREESHAEAEKTGELVKQLGLEHHLLSLDWRDDGGPPTRGKIQLAARNKRYPALLSLCERLDIRNLMLAHHMDDQNETFLIRMSKGSGLEGLGGMYPVTVFPEFPRVNILRPLLQIRKARLMEVCQNEGVEWIEDPSNQSDDFVRNNVRKILHENEDLIEGISQLMDTYQKARRVLKGQVSEALKKVDLTVNQEHGFLTLNLNKFRSLIPVVGKRVLQNLILHVGGARVELHYKSFAKLYNELHKETLKPQQIARCIVFSPHKHEGLLVIGRTLPGRKEQNDLVPISVGETVFWDGRWKIALKHLQDKNQERERNGGREQLYIRHMRPGDWSVAQRGIRKIRATPLPDRLVRGGLPVVSNKDGYIVLAPHFRVIDRSYGVDCDIKFEPLLPLSQDTDVHVC